MSLVNGFVWLEAVNEEINPVWQSLAFKLLGVAILFITLIYLYKSRINWQYEKKISRLKYKIENIEKEKKGLNAEIQQLKGEIKFKDSSIASLEEEIKKKEGMIKELNDKLKSCQKTLSEMESKNKALPEENPEEEAEGMKREHYGDLDYWTGERLYTIMHTSKKKRSLREMEELTGINYTTIRYHIKQYMDLHTTI